MFLIIIQRKKMIIDDNYTLIDYCELISKMKGMWMLVLLVLLSSWATADDEANYLQMRRTSCLVLSRYHSNTHKDTIEGIMKSLAPADQSKYINKMYATGVQLC